MVSNQNSNTDQPTRTNIILPFLFSSFSFIDGRLASGRQRSSGCWVSHHLAIMSQSHITGFVTTRCCFMFSLVLRLCLQETFFRIGCGVSYAGRLRDPEVYFVGSMRSLIWLMAQDACSAMRESSVSTAASRAERSPESPTFPRTTQTLRRKRFLLMRLIGDFLKRLRNSSSVRARKSRS